MASFQVECDFFVFPFFGNNHFALIPCLAAVFKFTGKTAYISGGCQHTFSAFVGTARQHDRFGKFCLIEF